MSVGIWPASFGCSLQDFRLRKKVGWQPAGRDSVASSQDSTPCYAVWFLSDSLKILLKIEVFGFANTMV